MVRLFDLCAWFVCLTTKPSKDVFSILVSKSSSKAQRVRDDIRVHWEASKQRTRAVITEFASEGSKVTVDVCPFDGHIDNLTILPLRGCVTSIILGITWEFYFICFRLSSLVLHVGVLIKGGEHSTF